MKSAAVVLALGLGMLLAGVGARAGLSPTNAAAQPLVPARSLPDLRGGVARPPSPRFQGTTLPAPPRQSARWSPPISDLPTNYEAATRRLYEQGLADPRGCDYRVIEVGTGDVWRGDGGVVETHGWVLPGKSSGRFAVCWNGLVYPVVGVGTNADWEADAARLATNGLSTWRSAIPEANAIAPNLLTGIKGCLLLRLGRADLAGRVWQSPIRHTPQFEALHQTGRFTQPVPSNGTVTDSNADRRRRAPGGTNEIYGDVPWPDTDPYLGWATEWAWAMFDRTVCAHMRGDESLALLTARLLADAQPKIEAECARRSFPRQKYWEPARHGQEKPCLDFLDQLPQLLTDLERRARVRDRARVVPDGLKTLTNQTERIAALIRDLDLVQAHQWGQPGGVALAEDPIVSALIQEGDPAVEPLLDCVEHDPRLTRSVSFGRDFFMSRNLIPASQAARSALPGILQAGFNDAAEIRGYWNQYKTLSLEERWHAMLRDDTARSRWLEAAGHIVQPKPITAYRGGFRGLTPPPAAPVRLRGERLRDKKNPAVTALLARRALEIPDANPKIYDLSEAGQMGLALAAWDPGAAGPVLQTLTKRCRTVMAYSDARLGLMLARLSLARAETGDPNAFEDYALWLPGTLPSQLDFSLAECLEPLEQFPTNILLQSVAEKLFTPANSAWSKLPWIGNAGINPASSDLVRVPAFRRLLVRELDRKEVCGTVSWQATGMVSYSMSNYWRGNFGYAFPEAGQTSDGASAELRWGDWIALSLSQAKIIPPFNPFAPVDKRDPPIRKAQETLAQP